MNEWAITSLPEPEYTIENFPRRSFGYIIAGGPWPNNTLVYSDYFGRITNLESGGHVESSENKFPDCRIMLLKNCELRITLRNQ